MFGRESKILIRPMEENDLSVVMPIEIDSFPDPWSPIAFLEDMRLNPRARYYSALKRGVVCGYLALWETSYGAEILKLAVVNSERNQGVGMALVRSALTELPDVRKDDYARVLVRAENTAAQGFYQKIGFVREGRFYGYYNAPPDDALVFVAPVHTLQR